MAPRKPRRDRSQRPATDAATGRTEVAVEARQQAPSSPAARSDPPRRVFVPAPQSPSPAPQPPARAVPPNGYRPPAPPPAAPPQPAAPVAWAGWPAWPAAAQPAVDPTAVVGRRIFAALVDGLVVLALGVAFYAVAVVALYDKAAFPPGTSNAGQACEIPRETSESCITLGNDVYVSSSRSLTVPPFLVLAGLPVLVLLPGLTGATPGKVVAGLRVVGPQGRPPGVWRALARTLLLAIDGFPWVVPLLGWYLARTTTHHRRLGDIVARTFVVRRKAYARR